jgi:phosphoribosylamine--glycine ligase
MNVLVIGSGAREHALVRAAGSHGHRASCAPGNAGIAQDASVHAISVEDHDALVDLAARERADLVIVGPELPLVRGLADRMRAAGLTVFGPGSRAAQLEGSKSFAKEFMARHGIPTAGFRAFDRSEDAIAYVRSAGRPLVVKADGLAAGKGVVVAADENEAIGAIDRMMVRQEFGSAGSRVVIEETLRGPEVSLHVLCDGDRFALLGAAQDHKRVGEGDTGPNTGGMGAYGPVPLFDAALEARAIESIVAPTVRGLREEGLPFRGVLFFGLMIHEGEPMLLEYNVRFGDPECAVLMARARGDVCDTLLHVARGALDPSTAVRLEGSALAVVIAAERYPERPIAGDEILGLSEAAAVEHVSVLHAGTRADGGRFVTAGGRVLTVVGAGETLREASSAAYSAVDRIAIRGAHHRRDIGWRALG